MSIVTDLRSWLGSLTDHRSPPNMAEREGPLEHDDTLAGDAIPPTPPLPDALGTFTGQRIRARVLGSLFDAPEEPLQIGRYRILKRLGAGGMGVVYAAYDTELDRKIALKLLGSARDAATLGERLRREGKALAKLSDPGIVQVYEVGEHDGHVFVAMEFVEGPTLRTWCEAEPRSIAQILAVFGAAARALAAAHAAGLVHRDFKPDNVVVGADRRNAAILRPRLLDFGLARTSEPEAIAATAHEGDVQSIATLTRTGAITGTPAYMAPEQFAGGMSDARTDQFAFCVALWEALFGARPFSGATFAELAANVIAGRRTLGRGRRVPGWLRAVLVRGLAVDPAARHPSMDALVAELARDRARRNLRLGAVLVSSAALAIGWSTWRSREAEHDQATSQLRDEVSGERTRADSAEEQLLRRADALTALEASNLVARDSTRAVATLANLRPEAPQWDGTVWQTATLAALRGVASRVMPMPPHHGAIHLLGEGRVAVTCERDPGDGGYGHACLLLGLADRTSVSIGGERTLHALVSSASGHRVALHDAETLWVIDEVAGTVAVPLPRDADARELVLSPDAGTLVLASAPITARDAAPGRNDRVTVWSLPQLGEPRQLALGKGRLAAVGDGGTLVWVADEGGVVEQVRPDGTRTRLGTHREGAVTCKTEERALAEIADGVLTVYEPSGTMLREEHRAYANAQQCSSVGGRTVVADGDGGVTLVEGGQARELEAPGGGPALVVTDGELALVLPLVGAPRVHALASRGVMTVPVDPQGSITWDRQRREILTARVGEGIRSWPMRWQQTFAPIEGSIDGLAWTEHGLVSGGTDGVLRRWSDDGTATAIASAGHGIVGLATTRDRESVALLDGGTLRTIDPRGPAVAVTPLPSQGVALPEENRALATSMRWMAALERLSRDGVVYSASGKTAVRRKDDAFELITASGTRRVLGEGEEWHALFVTDDDEAVIGVDWRNHLRRFELATSDDEWLADIEMASSGMALVQSPDGTWVALGGHDGVVQLRAATGAALRELHGPGQAVVSFAFSPDGRLLAGAALDGTGWIWAVDTGAAVEIETGLPLATAVSFAPSGAAIAFAGDGPVRVQPLAVPSEPAALQAWVRAATDLRVVPGELGPS